MSLANKYRSKRIREFIGNQETKLGLLQRIKNEDVPHTILITGGSGTGKTTLARCIAREVKTLGVGDFSFDWTELNSSDFTGIDIIRKINSRLGIAPFSSKYRVYFLDECHQLSAQAQEGFLKALESPPRHVILILATTEPKKLKDTLRRRCFHIKLESIDFPIMLKKLEEVAIAEDQKFPRKVIKEIAIQSEGSLGIALAKLERCFSAQTEKEQLKIAKEQIEEGGEYIKEIVNGLVFQNRTWDYFQPTLLKMKDEDPEGLRKQIIGICNGAILKQKNPNPIYFSIYENLSHPTYDNGFVDITMGFYAVWLQLQKEGK